jgi:23S rRNA pseudouridine2605 synthase
MSRDNNNSDRPKRPRISTKKSSDDSRASRSGNSSGSKPLKSLSLKTEEEKVPNIQDPTQNLKRNRSRKIPEVLITRDDSGSKSESRPYITNKSESYEKKIFRKT